MSERITKEIGDCTLRELHEELSKFENCNDAYKSITNVCECYPCLRCPHDICHREHSTNEVFKTETIVSKVDQHSNVSKK
jgi:hypothetical protein